MDTINDDFYGEVMKLQEEIKKKQENDKSAKEDNDNGKR